MTQHITNFFTHMHTLPEDVLHEIITHTFMFVPMNKYSNALWSQERHKNQRKQVAFKLIHADIRKRQHMRRLVPHYSLHSFEDFRIEGYEHSSMEEADNIIADEEMYQQEESAINYIFSHRLHSYAALYQGLPPIFAQSYV